MARASQPQVIGLTGNIACGKSTVATLLAESGLPVIDADQIAREVSRKGTIGFDAIVNMFGLQILGADGEIDRRKLRDAVFTDAEKRRKLEMVLHPEIRTKTADLIAAEVHKGQNTIIYEASLLFETGRDKDFDDILVITAPEELQIKRLLARTPELTPELARNIIATQMPQTDKAKLATWVIANDKGPGELRKKVQQWIELIKSGRKPRNLRK